MSSTRAKVEQARMWLTTAHDRSYAADEPHDTHAIDVLSNLKAATQRLRCAGRPDLAARLDDVLDGDVTTSRARREIREVISKIDAELEPAVDSSSFHAASDGGEPL